jgi:hypothetical protein
MKDKRHSCKGDLLENVILEGEEVKGRKALRFVLSRGEDHTSVRNRIHWQTVGISGAETTCCATTC